MSNEDLLGKIEGATPADEAPAAQLIAGAPSTSPPPVDLNAPLRTDGPTLAEYVDAGYAPETYPPRGYAAVEPHIGLTDAELAEAGIFSTVETAPPCVPGPSVNWQACTGQDVQAMIKAHSAGFVRTPGFTRADVFEFIASKGL